MIKRIAFITRNFAGACFPLVKQFLDRGYYVDYYIVCEGTLIIDEAMSVPPITVDELWGDIEDTRYQVLFDYFNSDKFRLRYYKRPRPYKRIPVVRDCVNCYTLLRDKRFCRHLNHQNYDFINIVGTYKYDDFVSFIMYIKAPVLVSLHEVIPDLLMKQEVEPSRFLRKVFLSNCQIIVHSKNTFKDIQQYKELNLNNLHLIHFGKFESFRTLNTNNNIIDNIPPSYILFYGRLLTYKGLDVLYDAVTKNRVLFKGHKIVVAGSGYVDCLDEIKKDESFILINRYISNEELATLIANSLFVVCPYRGISQSGIPQTTFVFNKPIVSSNLEAFKEVMTDGLDCLMFETDNSEDLAVKMKKMIKEGSIFEKNILEFENNHPSFDWRNIVTEYISTVQG